MKLLFFGSLALFSVLTLHFVLTHIVRNDTSIKKNLGCKNMYKD